MSAPSGEAGSATALRSVGERRSKLPAIPCRMRTASAAPAYAADQTTTRVASQLSSASPTPRRQEKLSSAGPSNPSRSFASRAFTKSERTRLFVSPSLRLFFFRLLNPQFLPDGRLLNAALTGRVQPLLAGDLS